MTTIRLEISYDGAGFSGWAAQPGMRTVQGELEAALATILGEPVWLTVAGRTDAGVHAWGQVASFRTGAEVPADLARRLNGVGPDDLARAGSRAGRRRLRRPPRRALANLLLPDPPPRLPEPVRARTGALVAACRWISGRWRSAPPRSSAATTSPPSPRPRATTSASSARCCGRSGSRSRRDRLLLDRGRRLHAQHGEDPGRHHARGRLGRRTVAEFDGACSGAPPASMQGKRSPPTASTSPRSPTRGRHRHRRIDRDEGPADQRRRHQRPGAPCPAPRAAPDRGDRGPRDRPRLEPQRHRAQHHHPLAADGRGGRLRRRLQRLRHRRHPGRLRPLRRPRPARARSPT